VHFRLCMPVFCVVFFACFLFSEEGRVGRNHLGFAVGSRDGLLHEQNEVFLRSGRKIWTRGETR